jgi:NAD(P)H dehydrogenase (quinone)
MKILLVWTHPNVESLSATFAKTMQETFEKQGHEVTLIDLYRSGFDPMSKDYYVSDIGEITCDDEPLVLEQRKAIESCNGLVFIYPVWWWDRPALLKGWFDRLFRWGFAIDVTTRGYIPRLTEKRALVVQTCGSSEEDLRAQGAIEPMRGIMVDGTLGLCGIQVDAIQTFYSVGKTDEEKLDKMKARLVEIASLWKAFA